MNSNSSAHSPAPSAPPPIRLRRVAEIIVILIIIGLIAGFVPRWLHPDDTRGVHGPDERISVENLERGIETMIRILQELDRQEGAAPPAAGRAAGG